MQTGNQIESQTESFTAMPVAFAQYPKDFQSPNDVFNFHSFACELSIEFLFCLRQLMQFAVLQWQNRFLGFALQAPIAQIGAQFQIFAQPHAAQLKQFIIVRPTFAEKRRRDLLTFFSNNKLCFQTVPLLLPAVKSALFFFGRSISLSVTSIIVYLSESASSRRFLPGRENFPDLIKISSIRRTSRETFERVQMPISSQMQQRSVFAPKRERQQNLVFN